MERDPEFPPATARLAGHVLTPGALISQIALFRGMGYLPNAVSRLVNLHPADIETLCPSPQKANEPQRTHPAFPAKPKRTRGTASPAATRKPRGTPAAKGGASVVGRTVQAQQPRSVERPCRTGSRSAPAKTARANGGARSPHCPSKRAGVAGARRRSGDPGAVKASAKGHTLATLIKAASAAKGKRPAVSGVRRSDRPRRKQL